MNRLQSLHIGSCHCRLLCTFPYVKTGLCGNSRTGLQTKWSSFLQESTNFVRNLDRNSSALKRNKSKSGNSGDGYSGRFVWRIENFTRLKDLLKKRKITALCIKSRHFQIGNRDCRLIVYPRGGIG